MIIIKPKISASHPSEDFKIARYNTDRILPIQPLAKGVFGGKIIHYTQSLADEDVDADKYIFLFRPNDDFIAVASLTCVGDYNEKIVLELTYATRNTYEQRGYASRITKSAIQEVSKALLKEKVTEIWLLAKVNDDNIASMKIAKSIFSHSPIKVMDPFHGSETMQFEELFMTQNLVNI